MYNYYNVFGFYTLRSTGNKHAIGRLLNSLIVGLNTRSRLPRLVVLVINKDIIEDVGIYEDSFHAIDVIAENVSWLFHQMEILFRRKRIDLTDKKPGAVYSKDPKVIVMEMIKCPMQFPHDSIMDGVLSLRTKFNSLLNDAACHFGFNRMYIEKCNSEFQFDRMGYLNNEGMDVFWREVDQLLEMFDCDEIKLLPRVEDRDHRDYLAQKKSRNSKVKSSAVRSKYH